MKKLHLILTGEWYDMIDRGDKPEEYRGLTNYYMSRILSPRKGIDADRFPWAIGWYDSKHSIVELQHGYSKNARRMRFKIEGVRVGPGEPKWGAAPGINYFVIKLGERITI